MATRERLKELGRWDVERQVSRFKTECGDIKVHYVDPATLKNKPKRTEWEICKDGKQRNNNQIKYNK